MKQIKVLMCRKEKYETSPAVFKYQLLPQEILGAVAGAGIASGDKAADRAG